MNKQQINIAFKTHSKLALWKIDNGTTKKEKHVFLTHGTFSNRKICMGISEFLVEKGYTCWILEWRNHGGSSVLSGDYNFETIGKEEIFTALQYLFEEQKLNKIDCITHSGGGISLTIHLIEYPHYRNRIHRIVFFGCQSFGAGNSFTKRTKIRLGKYFSKCLGTIPGRWIGNPHNEAYQFMKQWFNWNLSGQFRSDDGKDYCLEMPKIQIPVLSICGVGDTFIAPVAGCAKFLDAFNNPKNRLLVCGKKKGFLEDYNHSRLIYSRNAEQEIYPKVLLWLKS